jgi:arylsulfatase A-like enzyme
MLEWYDFPIRKHASKVTASMLEWIDEQDDGPFFVLANYFDAHNPYLPPPEFEARFVKRRPAAGVQYHPHTVIWWDNYGHPAAELDAQRDMYDGAIAWLDSELGRLFDGLETRGLLENSVVIITADHGEAFGEHGRLGHGADVYEELIHVPLIVAFGSRVPAGMRVAEAVTLADLPVTILDLVGIDDHDMPGQSLAMAWDAVDPGVPSSPILAHENTGAAMRSLLLDGWHYIRATGGKEELFDTATDPVELRDLSTDAAFAGRLARMRAAMDSALAITPDQRTGANADYVSRSPARNVALTKK